MTNYTAINRIADPIGFDIGQSDSRIQAERQNCYIVEDMTPEAKAYVVELAGIIETVDG